VYRFIVGRKNLCIYHVTIHRQLSTPIYTVSYSRILNYSDRFDHVSNVFQERAALRTIMESKIKGLVDNVMRVVSENSAEPAALGQAHGRLHRELSALQKLVNASIVALKYITYR